MKTIIVYATKSGASRDCAEILSALIKDCSLCDLSMQVPDIGSYDMVIIGSGVRMGKIYKPMRSFIENNTQALLMKKTAVFLCNAYPDTFQKVVEKNIPQDLIDRAIYIESLGGIPPFASPKNEDWILSEHVDRLVQAVTLKDKVNI